MPAPKVKIAFTEPVARPDLQSTSKARLLPADMDLDDDVASAIAIPGERIANAQEWMRGHGTYLDSSTASVLAGVAGRVDRVNKLVSVKPLRGRYKPEVGDLVIGRIVEVQARRWKVDVGARLDAVLMLSSINLPGGVQRRKLESDELQMRQWFKEGELLVCEVQAFFQDGSISLHTRSLSYGKLRNGQLVKGSPFLVPRLKTHFLSLASGVQLIIGLNGLIWVSTGGETSDVLATDVDPATELYSSKNHEIQPEKREAIARVACCIEALVEAGAMLTETRITAAWEASLEGEEDEATPVQQLAFSTASKLELVQRALAVA